ncbi:MAG: UTP--glucose-phosphate uridylyltransferase GalU [Actinomycetota bacterium]|jgi:UTP--glucose-1-phosphate uridylyltransferase
MSNNFKVTKALIPVAGLGTRFLPATKALPKEMLPLVDKPVIQYVVEEAVDTGLTDILMITGRNKSALENHFDRVAELEQTLMAKGDEDRLEQVQESTELADIYYTRQGDPKGLGHAVLTGKQHIGDHSFAVLLGDDVIDAKDPLLSRMIQIHEETGDNVIALMEVDPSEISMYGCAAVTKTEVGDVVIVNDLVEKPRTEDAPSNLAVIGRYILRPEMFKILETTEPGRGGEIQLTDALEAAVAHPEIAGGVRGVIFKGNRFDTGDKVGFLKAAMILGTRREDIGPELSAWLKEYAKTL